MAKENQINIESKTPLSKGALKHLKKVMSKKIFNSLSPLEKEEFMTQIKSIEKDTEHKNTIKIRVRPRIIQLLCKMAGVHDIKGGAYRGDTIYLGHSSYLSLPQLVQHEGIHIDQQVELGGFIAWLKKTVKDMKKYKEIHGDSPYIQYESSTLIPMELEAYAHQGDRGYLKNREPFAYKKYETPEGEQEAFKKISDRNDTEIKQQFSNKSPVGKNVEYDLYRLDEIINKHKETKRTMWVFNSVDKVNEITSILSLLEKKLFLLEKNPHLQNFTDENDKKKYNEKYGNWGNEFTHLKEKYFWETNNYNIQYMLENDFNDQETIKNTIKKLTEDRTMYRKEPAKFWLEPKKSKGENKESLQIEIPGKLSNIE